MGLVVDPGSFWNVMGDKFATELIKLLCAASEKYEVGPRPGGPLHVGGVGHGQQVCNEMGKFPAALKRGDGSYEAVNFTTAIIKDQGEQRAGPFRHECATTPTGDYGLL